MRRKDREVTDGQRIRDIIQSCSCCRLGLSDGGDVYIVPLSFGYEEADGARVFYFHSAPEGRKIELLTQHPHAAFELDTGGETAAAPTACGWTARYRSVIGTGDVSFITDTGRKRHALDCIMNHYARLLQHDTHNRPWQYQDEMLNQVCVFMLRVAELSCKEHR